MNLQVEFKKETKESAYDLVNLKHKEYYVEWLETKIEQLLLHDVVWQSEQLKAFGKSLQYKGVQILTNEGIEQAVKDFQSL